MPLAEDQHPVGDLGPGGAHEPFRISIRARAPGRDRPSLAARADQNRVERCGELPGPVAGQEPEARGAVAEIHQEIADLLGGPGPVRVRGDSGNVHVAGAGLDDEQAIQAPGRHGAVHGEEVGGTHRRGLRVQELPPRGVGPPLRSWGDLQGFEHAADRRRADPVA
jgi:hypothetical protein